MTEKRIIFITDLIDQRLRKEKEIEFYEEQLEEINRKLFWLRKEQQLTQTIIEIIENEKVHDIKEEMERKLIGGENDND